MSILQFQFFLFIKETYTFLDRRKIQLEIVSDIKKYNRANGIMWLLYGAGWLLAAIIGLFNIIAGTILVIILCIGLAVLISVSNSLRKKYFINY